MVTVSSVTVMELKSRLFYVLVSPPNGRVRFSTLATLG